MKLCMGCMNEIEDHVQECPHCGFDESNLQQEAYFLYPGFIIGGKYIIGRVLSYGGHTVSYLGMDAEQERKVIVKEYLPSDFSTRSEGEKEVTIYSGDALEQFEQGLTNFLNEANRIEHLDSIDGIAKVYDCVAENDTGYVISEYVEGETLKDILDSGKQYSVKDARRFIIRILQGLCQVHSLDIIHCDISPENIMVTLDDEIKLMDFGATRYVTTANSKSLAIILKQGYAPEEQYRSKGVRGPWTDVYALAAVMYRMITGIVPQESVERALSDELKEPSKLGIEIPRNIENALMNALNVYQAERTPSAEVFLKELKSKDVKRRKTKRKRNEVGKFPIWAKGLVACLACVVVVGGTALYKITDSNNSSIKNKESCKMPVLVEKDMDEAQKILNEVVDGTKLEGKVILKAKEICFDQDDSLNNTIFEQGIVEGENLLTYDFDTNLNVEKQGKKKIILCKKYSSKEISMEEIRQEPNAFSLAKKLGMLSDTTKENDKERFEGVEEEGHKPFELKAIKLKNETLDVSDLDNRRKNVKIKDIQKIQYYESEFIWVSKLQNMVGRNISQTYPTYKYDKSDETKKEIQGECTLSEYTNVYDDQFYSFEEPEGYIFWQDENTIGKEFSTSDIYTPIMKVVGTSISYEGKTGNQMEAILASELKDAQIIFAGSGDPSKKIRSISVIDEDGDEVTCFGKNQPIKIRLSMERKHKVEKKTSSRKKTLRRKSQKLPENKEPI